MSDVCRLFGMKKNITNFPRFSQNPLERDIFGGSDSELSSEDEGEEWPINPFED